MSSATGLAREALVMERSVYPERIDRSDGICDRLGHALYGVVVRASSGLRRRSYMRIVKLAEAHASGFAAMNDRELGASCRELRRDLRRGDIPIELVAKGFALIREVAERSVGTRPFDVQLAGGYALYRGNMVEMETGEGKTLTATLPAGLAALGGTPVHVVTVNDYLAQRDAESMGPIYRFLGLSVGVITHGLTQQQKRAAYNCDVVYCTNKELAFDYLRDRMILAHASGNLRLKFEALYGEGARTQSLLLRGLHFAIVDEADSVLIDEARTPLIISGRDEPDEERAAIYEALALIEELSEGREYIVRRDERIVELTQRGKERLRQLTSGLGPFWQREVVREEMVRQALTARFLFSDGEQYLVRDGKVQIVDEYTGRVMADRFWSQGLHQLIEAKEGCELSGRRPTLARMTYQRFFRRYRHLCGMTGTAKEVAAELWSVFGLPVVRVPTNRPLRRKYLGNRVCVTLDRKWGTIAKRVRMLHEEGRPVLVGTRSVAASDQASSYLTKLGLPHVVLNAAQDEAEADIIALAGQRGRITVATNMAGRGTDIILGDDVASLGGLAVIMSERHDAARVDRQLAGRAGRHGEPGSYEAVLSLEDPLLQFIEGNRFHRTLLRLARYAGGPFRPSMLSLAQRKAEQLHSRMRRDLVKYDRKVANALAFSGRPE